MNTRKAFFSFLTLVLMMAVISPVARADDNGTERFTFSQTVAIPGQILPAGSYWFVPQDDNPNLVVVYNADRTKVIGAFNTVPSLRAKRTDDAVVSFAERTSGQPAAIMSWFYPGMLDGHQFMYSSQEERELAGDSKLVVAAPSATSSGKAISGE